ncbi:hypothetical protein GCM10022253_23960 [Sphingomonas endophytica]|uniref:Uncharacterized protein n=1 Tax=Sphingomonas endophytica TaxID=869719 RepID=A0ABR6N2M5_9SPHN|nr:hypothetical protein [Sphingomonas endophytica]MBB5725044.1 hypothetical protein [Sphingomonas endophytica]
MPAPDFATEIAELERGLGSGVARVESEGESVTYRGVRDITKALAYFRQRVTEAPVAYPRSSTTLAAFDPD